MFWHASVFVFVLWRILKCTLTLFSLFPPCIPDNQAHRITSTKFCINTVFSPDDWTIFTRNMYIVIHTKNKLCTKLLFTKLLRLLLLSGIEIHVSVSICVDLGTWKNSYTSPQFGCRTTAREKFIIYLQTLELQPTSSPSSSKVRLVLSCTRVNKAHSTINFACGSQTFFRRNSWHLR
jgi:hypothetical protein